MMVVLLLTSPNTADDDVAGKQLDWLTSTAASLSRAQQHSAEYDSMVKSIGLATGAATVAPRQELHLPKNVVPQPKKEQHASGKLLYDDFAWQFQVLECLAKHVCSEAGNRLPIFLC